MISGTDIVLEGQGTASALLSVAAVIWMEWEGAVFQDGQGRAFDYVDLPFDQLTELFAYRDKAAWKSWSQDGMTESNADSMIYLILRDGDLTLVVNNANEPETSLLVAAIRKALDLPA